MSRGYAGDTLQRTLLKITSKNFTSPMSAAMVLTAAAVLLLTPATAWNTHHAPPAPAPAPAPHYVNLTALLSLAGPFQTFLARLTDTQAMQAVQNQANNSDQGVTVFAPSDDAFSSLAAPPLSNLTVDQLRSLLLYHALPKFYTLTDLAKNLSGLSVATMAGGQFTLNVTDSSGLVRLDSDWIHTSISSSVYSSSPVAVYKVDRVLLPKAIFGSAPPQPPQAPPPVLPPSPPEARSPPSDGEGPSPRPAETPTTDESYSYRASLGAITCLAFVVSSVLMFSS